MTQDIKLSHANKYSVEIVNNYILLITLQYQSNSEIKETPTEDCVLDCPKTDKPCNHATCCGPSKQVCVLCINRYNLL